MKRLKLILILLFPYITSFTFAQTPGNKKLVTTQKPKVQKIQPKGNLSENYNPDFFLLIDSKLGEWKKSGKKLKLKSYDDYEYGSELKPYGIDSIGNLYAIGALTRDYSYFNHVFRFANNEWKLFEQNMPEQIESLLTDGKGTVYGISKTKIYQASGDKWEEIFNGNFKNYNVFAGNDGNIYIKDQVYKKNKYQYSRLYKVKNGSLEVLLDNGKPLDNGFDIYEYLFIDHIGLLYQYDNKKMRIGIWDSKEWKYTDSIEIHLDDSWCFDKNNNLYIACKQMFENLKISKLEGKSWKQLPIPDSIGKKNNYWKFISDYTGNVYLQFDIEFEEANLYRINNDTLENLGKQQERKQYSQGIKTFLIAGDKYFALTEDKEYISEEGSFKEVVEPVYYYPVLDVNIRKMAYIPNYEAVSEPYKKEYKNLFKCFLFEGSKGKYGLQTMDGRIIAEDNFDKIYIGYTPSHLLEVKGEEFLRPFGTLYCYILISGKDTMYSYIGNYDSELPENGTLSMFKGKVSSTCSNCNGTGVIKAHQETITVKGNWIPSSGSTFTSTSYDKRWDGNLKQYVMHVTTKTTTTGGGSYAPDKLKTINIPEHKCEKCEGRPQKYSYQVYKLNRSTMSYYITWD